MKTILVTGGAGFIGSHLCRYLLDKGNYVICIDNFYTGNINNIKDLKSNPNFELMRHDITWPLVLEGDATTKGLNIQIVGDDVGIGGGTEYTEDVATANPQVGRAIMVERDDQLAAVTPVEADWIGLRGTAKPRVGYSRPLALTLPRQRLTHTKRPWK